jgi:2'-hydroxyisoflavone reductase
MRILLLGGTAFLGSRIATAALARGHEVVAAARGASGSVPDGVRLVAVDRDRDDALAPLAAERWDAVVDLSRQPGHARRAARDLAPVARHVVFVSSASVYADHSMVFDDETGATLPPLEADAYDDPADYGSAKAACELAWSTATEGRASIVRAGLIGGPGDESDRTGWWPYRFASPASPGGAVLVPDAGHPVAVLDARDLADWIVALAGSRAPGPRDAVGEVLPLPEHLARAEAVGGVGWALPADPDWLAAHDVTPWTGPRSLPLWLPPESIGMNARAARLAAEAGLVSRPLEDTLRDSRDWQLGRGEVARRSGLADDAERSLLAELGAG